MPFITLFIFISFRGLIHDIKEGEEYKLIDRCSYWWCMRISDTFPIFLWLVCCGSSHISRIQGIKDVLWRYFKTSGQVADYFGKWVDIRIHMRVSRFLSIFMGAMSFSIPWCFCGGKENPYGIPLMSILQDSW